ncbi:MAG: histidinol-phosphate transaminase [Erythrobacter sp.]
MTDRPTLKPWIEAIHAYVPGKSKAADGRPLAKLSANENPLGCSPDVLKALSEGHQPNFYPDPDATALREAIGTAHGIDAAHIVCGSGSAELLQCAVQAFAGPGDEVLFSRFSFSLYPLLVHMVGAEVVMADTVDYAPDVDNILAAVTERTRVVLLDNPNNPIGAWLPRGDVERLHAGLPGNVLLVVDQAYAEFLEDDEDDGGLELAARHDNVLVTRTFSKAFGIAGERVGWATGALHLVDALNRLRGAFNVTESGQKAALAALGDMEFLRRTRDTNNASMKRFIEHLTALGNHGVRCLPSKANFVLVVFDGKLAATTALEAIANAGYAVRHLPGQGLPEALRITIGTDQQMDDIAAVLRRLCEGVA